MRFCFSLSLSLFQILRVEIWPPMTKCGRSAMPLPNTNKTMVTYSCWVRVWGKKKLKRSSSLFLQLEKPSSKKSNELNGLLSWHLTLGRKLFALFSNWKHKIGHDKLNRKLGFGRRKEGTVIVGTVSYSIVPLTHTHTHNALPIWPTKWPTGEWLVGGRGWCHYLCIADVILR